MSASHRAVSSRLARLLLVAVIAWTLAAADTGRNVAQAQDVTPTVILSAHPVFGMILTDAYGFTLYTWAADDIGVSNCYEACAEAWPPLIAWDELIAPPGLAGTLDWVDRGDGTWQVSLDGWPLYHYWADTQPGDVNGHGSMGFGARWDVVAMGPAPAAEQPIPAPPVALPPAPPPPAARMPEPGAPVPPAAAIPAGPPTTPTLDPSQMGLPPGFDPGQMPPPPGIDPSQLGFPPGMMPPPPPGQATIPPGYNPTVTVVVPPNGTIGLNWLPTPSAQSYRIYQTLASQPLNFSVVQTVNQTPGQLATNAVLSGLQPGNTYFLQVRAVEPGGAELPAPTSALVGPSPNAGIPGPGVGTSPLTIGGTTPTSIMLNWTPIPGARSYVVLQALTPTGPFIPANMTQMTPTGATIIGLQPNTMYYFQLMAVDALGNQSPASGTVSLMTAPLAASTSASVNVSNVTSTTANLSWAAVPGAISYQVVMSFSPIGPWIPAAVVNPVPNGTTVTGLNPGTTYYFQVIALDAMGAQIMASTPATVSTLSASAPVVTTALAPPSSVLTSSTTGSSVTLSWMPSPGATSYLILQSTGGAGPFSPAAVSTVSGTSATIAGLNPNTVYFFQVIAVDVMGRQSAPSVMVTAMTTSPMASPR